MSAIYIILEHKSNKIHQLAPWFLFKLILNKKNGHISVKQIFRLSTEWAISFGFQAKIECCKHCTTGCLSPYAARSFSTQLFCWSSPASNWPIQMNHRQVQKFSTSGSSPLNTLKYVLKLKFQRKNRSTFMWGPDHNMQ